MSISVKGQCVYFCRNSQERYGVATVSRIDSIIGLFCRTASLLSVSFAKETCNFIDPTQCSHPIRTHGLETRIDTEKKTQT